MGRLHPGRWGLLALAGALSCHTDALVGDGEPAVEERAVDLFDTVVVWHQVGARIVAGSQWAATVHCDGNLIDEVTTEVVDGALQIGASPEVLLAPRSDCYVEVVTPVLAILLASGPGDVWSSDDCGCLEQVIHTGRGDLHLATAVGAHVRVMAGGDGDLTIEGMDVTNLDLREEGAGEVHLEGLAPLATYAVIGRGDVHARGVRSERVQLLHDGSGELEVTATDAADAVVTGSGDVIIHGRPAERSEEVSGSGRVSWE